MAAVFGAAGQGVSERVHRVLIEDVVIFRTISKSVVNNHDDKWYTVFPSSEAPDTLANPIFDPEVREEQDYAAANTPPTSLSVNELPIFHRTVLSIL